MQDPRMTRAEFSARLCGAMKIRGLSAGELARLTATHGEKLHEMTIRQWMKGVCQPRHYSRAKLIATCLGVSAEWLCYGTQPNNATNAEEKR